MMKTDKLCVSINGKTFSGDVVFTCDGLYTMDADKYEINTSSILTRLIQEAGRWCESYASDLFVDWRKIAASIETISPFPSQSVHLFGFRRSGVDHDAFVEARQSNDPYLQVYRALWALEITEECDGDCDSNGVYIGRMKMTMKLARLD